MPASKLPVATTNGNQTYAQMAQYAAFLPKELYIPAADFLKSAAASQGARSRRPRKQPSSRRSRAPTSSRTVPRPMPGIRRCWSSSALRKLKPDATAADLRAYFHDLKGVAGINGLYDFKAVPNRGLG